MQDGSGEFTNAVAAFDTRLAPLPLLAALQKIEVDLGRPADHGKNVARTIDLDLLLYGSKCLDLPELKIPHPRMLERLFVLLPLQEVLPELVLDGRALSHWIDSAPAMEMIRV